MKRRLMAIFAHPDDESLGVGATLAKYAAEGVETSLITATRGQAGWFGSPGDDPGPEKLGVLREAELRNAARELGIQRLEILDYMDGQLANASAFQVTRQIARLVREIRPQVVVTFDPQGNYGHPDHIAICQLTTSALIHAAAADTFRSDYPPHQVEKLYYFVNDTISSEMFRTYFGDITMEVDGVVRSMITWPDWSITTRLDLTDYWLPAKRAILCHQTQLPSLEGIERLSDDDWCKLAVSMNTYFRVSSLVAVGPGVETDLFAGIQ